MRILALIPARGGSKGIPGKNIKPLKGRPLLAYTLDSVKQSRMLSRVVLSTEDKEIAEVGRRLGLEVPFLRPLELAKDDTPTLQVVQHCLRELENQGSSYDVVCLLQTTSPFRQLGIIDTCIRKFKVSGADSLVSVRRVPDEYNPHWVFQPDVQGLLKLVIGEKCIISRRQDLPEAYIRDGALYLTKVQVVMNGSLYGKSISYMLHEPPYHVNLDTIEDWIKAEQFICAE